MRSVRPTSLPAQRSTHPRAISTEPRATRLPTRERTNTGPRSRAGGAERCYGGGVVRIGRVVPRPVQIALGLAALGGAGLMLVGAPTTPAGGTGWIPVGAPTTPAVGAATLHMSPGGTGTTCTKASPCGSMDSAYQTARMGDTVLMAGGHYGDQLIRPRSLPGGGSARPSGDEITFRPRSSTAVTIADLIVGGVRSAPVQHIAFEDIEVTGWTATRSAADIHFTRIRHRGQVHANWVEYLSYRNGEVGPVSDDTGDGLQFNQIDGRAGHHLLVKGMDIHDVHPDNAAAHPDAIQFFGPYHDVTLSGNRLWNNDNINLRGDGLMKRLVVENNFFGAAHDPVVPRYYTAQIPGDGAIIRYNSFDGSVQPAPSDQWSGQLWEGNVMTWTTCQVTGPDSTVRFNVWLGGRACGSARRHVRGRVFADSSSGDLHLRPGSAPIGAGNPRSHPPRDIDGDVRPANGRPDAGADELERDGAISERRPGSRLAFTGLRVSRTRHGHVVHLRLSAPARLGGRVERRQGGSYRTVRRLRSRRAAAGTVRIRLARLPPGRYRVRLSAVNRRGERRRASVRVRVPPR
jgi:hypothetical protein